MRLLLGNIPLAWYFASPGHLVYHTYFLITRHLESRSLLDRIAYKTFWKLYPYMLKKRLFGPPYHTERIRYVLGVLRNYSY
jgi:hypothetical protein